MKLSVLSSNATFATSLTLCHLFFDSLEFKFINERKRTFFCSHLFISSRSFIFFVFEALLALAFFKRSSPGAEHVRGVSWKKKVKRGGG